MLFKSMIYCYIKCAKLNKIRKGMDVRMKEGRKETERHEKSQTSRKCNREEQI